MVCSGFSTTEGNDEVSRCEEMPDLLTRTVWSNNSFLFECRRFILLSYALVITKAQKLDISTVAIKKARAKWNGLTHFFAPFRRSASSRSFCASSLARCCARFSSAVIRGTISSNGFSTIRIVLIFGGLQSRNQYVQDDLNAKTN